MKLVSLILFVLGLGALALSVPPVNELVANYLDFLEGISNFVFIVIGIVLVLLGVMLMRPSSREDEEIPIYKGKKIVGYRRG
jgi:hypothetical protein